MNKHNFFKILPFILTVVVFTGCKDKVSEIQNQRPVQRLAEKGLILSNITTQDGMLVFDSLRYFLEDIKVFAAIPEEYRSEFEQSLNFQSFGTIADNFYRSIDFESFQTEQDVFSFIELNAEMLDNEQVEGKDSLEIVTLPRMVSNPERWIMNDKKMYIVENAVYRYFTDDIIVSTENKPEKVKALAEATVWQTFRENKDFSVYSLTEDILQSTTGDIYNEYCQSPTHIKTKFDENEKNKNGDMRTHIIVKTKVHKKYYAFKSITAKKDYYYPTIDFTMVNEKHKQFWGFLWYYWSDITACMDGKVNIDAEICRYNDGVYEPIYFHPSFSSDDDEFLKIITEIFYGITDKICFAKVNIVFGGEYDNIQLVESGVKKPKIWLEEVDVNIDVSNGVNWHQTYNYLD
ncbi:MAG: hypothetical protein LBN95_09525 [Prevotellaceae bacterium]|jgi:hypothetical protein|nr:hypothetical protein [Prevotellaceae bacterium]